MRYKNYQKDLNRILESELFGIALFSTAAKFTQHDMRQKKWQALTALEQQTLARLNDFLELSHQHASARFYIQMKGQVLGYILAKLPWGVSMYLLKDGTQPFMQVFERLSQHANPQEQAFFDYVLAHEKSIYDFAEKELNRQSSTSLISVQQLLALKNE